VSDPASFTPPPPDAVLRALLDAHAPLTSAPLCPEIRIFHATSLVTVWEAAEGSVGRVLPSPFWAYPWPAGAALARYVLDHVHDIAGRRVLDFGCGGAIASLAATLAGAAAVVANDVDPWALAVARLAAAAQEPPLTLTTCATDFTAPNAPSIDDFNVVLCGDLGYERSVAGAQRAVLERARAAGARVFVADAGRPYFQADGLTCLATHTLDVPKDLEGVARRTAVVYELTG
jgi:predicted nicotinamide N-methyase